MSSSCWALRRGSQGVPWVFFTNRASPALGSPSRWHSPLFAKPVFSVWNPVRSDSLSNHLSATPPPRTFQTTQKQSHCTSATRRHESDHVDQPRGCVPVCAKFNNPWDHPMLYFKSVWVFLTISHVTLYESSPLRVSHSSTSERCRFFSSEPRHFWLTRNFDRFPCKPVNRLNSTFSGFCVLARALVWCCRGSARRSLLSLRLRRTLGRSKLSGVRRIRVPAPPSEMSDKISRVCVLFCALPRAQAG